MKKIFELTNKYIIVATPLILFSLLSSIYTVVSVQSKNALSIIIALIILFLMSAAFISGWGKMLKSAASDDSPQEPNSIIKIFPSGVGEYFLSSCGVLIIAAFVNILFLLFAFFIGIHFIGDIGIGVNEFSKAMATQEALKTFLASLSATQLIKINMWNMLLLGCMALISFLLFLYLPAIFYSTKNPFKALYISNRYIFSRKFFNTLGIYLLIFGINFFISIFSALFAGNVIANFVMTFINFYFICCVAIGIFYYYNNHFVNPKPGQIIDKVI